jgi:16S rRNA (adenine1518-N6/adenine1519-N6)-dimethyltransferase
MARQRLGQHFLADPAVRERIRASLPLRPNDIWLEIGAGHGEMTQHLVGEGRRVIAVESDPHLAEDLKKRQREWPGMSLVEGGILTLELAYNGLSAFHVYGNIPYYITSPILHHLFNFAPNIRSIHVVLQLEVAERIVSRPKRKSYGYLSALCQFYARPEIILEIPPAAFRPPPKVRSALVSMSLPGERENLGVAPEDEARFLEFVQLCFAQKRKTLRNNLRSLAPPAHLAATLAAAGLRADARAEQLALSDFAALFRALAPP